MAIACGGYSATAWRAPNQECKTLRSKGSETEVSEMLKGPERRRHLGMAIAAQAPRAARGFPPPHFQIPEFR
jgi:hypothetical protein